MRFAARIAIPGAILIAGLVLLALPGLAVLGFAFIIISFLTWLADVLARLTLASQSDREREDREREAFARTGRWPDEHSR